MMRTRLVLACSLACLTLAAPLSRAQSLDEIDKREAAVYDAWAKTPLTVRKAVFITGRADGYGMYKPREGRAFKPGEPLVLYAEPIGYGWRPRNGGGYEFGFDVDFLIKTSDGKVLGGQQNFAKLVKESFVRNREFMLTLTMNVSGADPGDYVLEYKLRDVAGDKKTAIELPFTIVK